MQEIIYIKYEIQGKLYKNESNWDFYFDLDNDYLDNKYKKKYLFYQLLI